MPETSPTKWHLGHTTWFFERFCLRPYARRYVSFDDRYDYLFNSYYYTVGQMHSRAERGLLSRPTVEEVRDYRAYVDDAMDVLLRQRGADPRIASVVELGLNHEQQHQELLLTDIKQVFFMNPLKPAYAALRRPPMGGATPMSFVPRSGGVVEMGASGGGFCFDNETPRHRVLIEDHALASRLVTNAEYREFIRSAGYRTPSLWLADGWAQIRERGWDRPGCWSSDLGREFTLGGWREIDEAAPVSHVSFYEADAFARFAGARLPTEAEWENSAAAVELDGNLARQRFFASGRSGRWGFVARTALRRRLGMVLLGLCAISRVQTARWVARRVQRQVHVQPARRPRRIVRDAARPHSADVSQLLLSTRSVAVLGISDRQEPLNGDSQ